MLAMKNVLITFVAEGTPGENQIIKNIHLLLFKD